MLSAGYSMPYILYQLTACPLSLEQSVRDDVQIVKDSPLVRKELAARTRGFVYDIKTGKVNPVG